MNNNALRFCMPLILLGAICVPNLANAQLISDDHKAVVTWDISVFEMGTNEDRPYYIMGVLTPVKPITIRRVEAISNSGPKLTVPGYGTTPPSRDPVPCPVQYNLEVTNGVVAQSVPLSNVFIQKKSSQTATDSGPVSWSFSANSRITIALVFPKQTFPPVFCGINGLNITVQYEVADEPQEEKKQ